MTESANPELRPLAAARRFRRASGLGFDYLNFDRLREVLGQMGVRVAEHPPLTTHDGSTYLVEGSGWHIDLAPSTSGVRRTFTLAHEIGHYVYRSQELTSHENEEVWCNRFAADLLMPRERVRTEFADAEQSIVSIDALARRAGVSMASAAIQLGSTCNWRIGLLQFIRDQGEWRLKSAHTPDPVMNLMTLRVLEETAATLNAARTQRNLRFPIGFRGRRIILTVELISKPDRSWIAFAMPRCAGADHANAHGLRISGPLPSRHDQ